MRLVFRLLSTFGLVAALSSPVTAEIVKTGVPGMLLDHDVHVAMTDGAQLSLNIYRPAKPGRYPVVMLMGPYGKDTHYSGSPVYKASWDRLTAKYPDLCKQSTCRFMRWEAPDPERWVPDGYIIIHADSRGSGGSPGMLTPFSPRESEDYASLITWASLQPWSNGKVGLLGTSYMAINQWQVAARQPKGLAAILPWEGAFDFYNEAAYSGGVPNTVWKFWWERQLVSNQNGNASTPFTDWSTGSKSTGTPLSPELLKQNRNSPVEVYAGALLDGAYYRERTPDASRITVPILDVANWKGWSTEGYVRAASKSKWLRLQTGDHLTPFYSDEALAVQKRYFDHFLKGLNNGWQQEPSVSVLIRRPNAPFWRKEAAWPLPGTQWERTYLDASDGSMDPGKRTVAAAQKSYSATADGVTFKTAPFTQDTEFTGPVMAKLWVKSSTSDMDIFAYVRLIDPEGRDVTFQGGTLPREPASQAILRVSHRALDAKRSTDYRPFYSNQAIEPIVPGQAYEVSLQFEPTSIVVPKGYRLALSIQGKDWQYAADARTVGAGDYSLPGDPASLGTAAFAAHPNRDPALYGGTNWIATGAGQASYLLLPRIPDRR